MMVGGLGKHHLLIWKARHQGWLGIIVPVSFRDGCSLMVLVHSMEDKKTVMFIRVGEQIMSV